MSHLPWRGGSRRSPRGSRPQCPPEPTLSRASTAPYRLRRNGRCTGTHRSSVVAPVGRDSGGSDEREWMGVGCVQPGERFVVGVLDLPFNPSFSAPASHSPTPAIVVALGAPPEVAGPGVELAMPTGPALLRQEREQVGHRVSSFPLGRTGIFLATGRSTYTPQWAALLEPALISHVVFTDWTYPRSGSRHS